jgi:hypothetical protein
MQRCYSARGSKGLALISDGYNTRLQASRIASVRAATVGRGSAHELPMSPTAQ